MSSVAIMGAGLLGRLLAFRLKDDFEVTLFDQDSGEAEQSAAVLAAAMLAPVAESTEAGEAVMELGIEAQKLWPEILAQLEETVFFQQQGSLVVAFEQDVGSLKMFTNSLKSDQYQSVNSDKIRQLEPELDTRLKRGVFLPTEGQLDNRQLLLALKKSLLNSCSKVTWKTGVKLAVDVEGGYLANGHKVRNGDQPFDWLIDCRGIGGKTDFMALRGVRGEVIRLHAPQVTLNRPVRLMHPRYPIYIAPKEHHQFVVGATQLETEDHRAPTVLSALELLSACYSVHKGFAEAEILEIKAGLRPTLPDNQPKILQQGNVLAINGLYRHGYLLSPVMVEACRQLMLTGNVHQKWLRIMPQMLQIQALHNTLSIHDYKEAG